MRPTNRWAWIGGLAGVVLSCGAQGAPAPRLPRVASVSLCGDEFLIRLADRAQIASVSLKADRPLGRFPAQVRTLPRNNKSVEEMLAQDVDIVVLESGGESQFATALRRVGVRTVMLPKGSASDLKTIEAGLRRMGAAIGRPERADAIIADMRRRAAVLAADRPALEDRPIAAYARPEGGGAGAGTFVNLTFELAGFRNFQALAGQKGWAKIAMEDVVMRPPDVFVASFFDTRRNSLAAVRGRNPLFGRLQAPVVNVPGRYLVCAGPSILDAAEQLHAERLRLFPRTRL